MGVQGHLVSVCFMLSETEKWLSRVTIPCGVPKSHMWAPVLSHALLRSRCPGSIIAFLGHLQPHLIVVFLCISLMPKDGENLITWVFATHMSSLRRVCSSLRRFLTWDFCLLTEFQESFPYSGKAICKYLFQYENCIYFLPITELI